MDRRLLTADQQTSFAETGFLVVEDVLDQGALAAVRAEYAAVLDAMCAYWRAEGRLPDLTGRSFDEKIIAAYEAGCDWFQPMDISLPGGEIHDDTPMHFGPAVFDMVTHPRVLDLVEDLIGPEITSNPIQHVRIKPPARSLTATEDRPHVTYTGWHQDQGVTHEEADATDMVTVWLAISDATVENGCLQVLPGRHREDLKAHCPTGIQLNIPDAVMAKDAATPCPVKAGGAVVFHPKTPHASLINRSNGVRWSFDLRYNVTGQPTGRSHFPEFVARSRAAPQNELRSHVAWRKMWEDARERLAVRPHIPIHRWDADAPACA